MKEHKSKFPTKSIQQIKLNAIEKDDVIKEFLQSKTLDQSLLEFDWSYDLQNDVKNKNLNLSESCHVKTIKIIPDAVIKRYELSCYLIDPNKHRFKTVIRILAFVIKFIKTLKRLLISSKSKNKTFVTDISRNVKLSINDIKDAENYFFRKATNEIKKFLKPSQYEKFSVEKDEILFYSGRILPSTNVTVVGKMTEIMKDLSSTTFCVPLIDKDSPIAYSLVNEVHWFDDIAKHSGIESTYRQILKRAFVIEGRELIKKFRKNCERCRYITKKTIDVTMGPITRHQLNIAPAFFVTQVDLCGPFKAYSPHNKRTTIKVWFAVFVCTTTSSTNIKIMDDYSSTSFISTFIRFSCEVGYPKVLLIDEGSQLKKACQSLELNFKDLQNKLYQKWMVEFEVCPVGGHNFHGKVERKIQQVKSSLEKNTQNERLSIIQWETLMAQVANTINDLPLALGNIVADFESLDLLTPNRLRLGRNNDRSPVFPLNVTSNFDKIISDNVRIFNTWFENWLLCYVPKLMHKPKWFNSDRDTKPGDVVLFLKHDKIIENTYKYGIVKGVQIGNDQRIRSVTIRYRNNNENFDRETNRAVRHLVMIHPVDELNLVEELGKIATFADVKLKLSNK